MEEFKVGDKVVVSATATGYGRDIPGYIDKIETFMNETLISVTYTPYNPEYGLGGVFVAKHIKKRMD